MYPVTTDFREAIVAGVQAAVVQVSVTLDDSDLGEVPFTAGAVECDGTRDGALRSLSLTIAPHPDAFSWLAAAGAEIVVERGLALRPEVPSIVTSRHSAGVVPGAVLELLASAANLGTNPGVNSPLTTQWFDTSGNGNHGTLTGFGGQTPWAGAGTVDDPYRLAFDGGDDLIALPDLGACEDKVFTYEVWASVSGNDSACTLICESIVNPNSTAARLEVNAGGYLQAVMFDNDSALGYRTSPLQVNDGVLRHMLLVCDGANGQLYADGAPAGAAFALPGGSVSTLFSTVGMQPYGSTYLTGSALVARVYPFALTPEQVAQNYAAGLATTDTFTDQPFVEELVPLGVFILDADLDEADDGTITVSAADRSQRISRARWTDPYTVPAGTNVGDGLTDLLTTCWPDCPIGATLGAISKVTTAKVVYLDGADSDPWKDARALAASSGHDLYFDGAGEVQVRDTPDPESDPVCATYYAGEQAIILEQTRSARLSQLYNGVIVTAEGSGVAIPKRGEEWDDDPNSPTYCDGPMGRVPLFYSSPLLTTQDDVDSAAQTMLARVKRPIEQVSFTLVPNPAHEAFDVVEFVDEDGVARRYMLDVVTTPLDSSGPMTATTRETEVT